MGAWGEGMQANDTALDAIDMLEKGQSLGKALAKVKKWDARSRTMAILGLAEHALDQGKNITKHRAVIDEAIAHELDSDRLDCWRNPDQRKAALELLRKRLNGEQVSQTDIDQTNEGLLGKIFRHSTGISYEDFYE